MLKNIFSNIYEKNIWRSSESRSGGGSEILRTQSVRANLVPLLKRLEVKTLLDAGCGDWNWMSRIDFEGIKVFACDIVESMTLDNRMRFSHKADFFSADITRDQLPQVDMILCRTVLFHLKYANVFLALECFKRSGSRYLLVTHYPNCMENRDISQDGMWRRLNLCLAPFNFPAPLEMMQDGAEEDGYLGLWSLEAL